MFFNNDTSFRILTVLELDWQGNDVDVQPRPFHALSIRINGNSTISDSAQSVHLKDNDLLYMPANVPYHITSGYEHILVIHFEMSGSQPLDFTSYSPANAAIFRETFMNLLDVWNQKRVGYYFKAVSVFYKILEQLTRQFNPGYSEHSYLAIQPAVNYLHENISDPELNIAHLCRLANMSDTQFRKNFAEVFNTTPIRYINTLRTDYAADLLDSSFYSVEEIGLRSGFTDPKYFSTVFKKYKDCSPSQFRNLNSIKKL